MLDTTSPELLTVQKRQSSAWTDARVAELLRLFHNTEMSCGLMAESLGCSRNAVIGRLHRMGLHREGKPAQTKPRGAPRSQSPRSAQLDRPGFKRDGIGRAETRARKRANSRFTDVRPSTPKNRQPGSVVLPFELVPGAVGIFEVAGCRWPVGDGCGYQQLFCDGPLARRNYCATHAAMAYTGAR